MENIKKFGIFESKEERMRRIREEIEKKQRELEKLETGKRTGIIELEEYTEEDKIKFFDKLYKFTLSCVEDFEKRGGGEPPKDTDHYVFEEAM